MALALYYFISCFLLSISDFVVRRRRVFSATILSLSFLLFLFPLALRHELVGIDTWAYYRIFEVIFYEDDPFLRLRYEPGYTFINLAVKYFGGGPEFVIMISAVASLLPFFYVIIKYSRSYLASASILCGVGVYGFMFNGVRQAIAMGIVFFAFHLILRKKYLISFFFILIASMFHFTAIIFVFSYIFVFRLFRLGFVSAFLVWVFSLLFMFPFVADMAMGYLGLIVPDVYVSYVQSGDSESGFRLRYLANQLFCVLLLYFVYVRKRFGFGHVALLFLYVTLFGFVLSNFFVHMGYLQRIALYFVMISCVALPFLAFEVFNRISFVVFVLFCFFVFSVFYIRGLSLGSNGIVPYFTIFG